MFKYNELKKFFKEIRKSGPVQLFCERNTENCFRIRHDIDFDLFSAYKMAVLENEAGIKATYFILTTSPLYNTLTSQNKTYINEIKKLGHEIALHFDPTLYNKDKLNEAVSLEVAILESITGSAIKSISLHNPTSHGQYPIFDSFNNAYAQEFFNPDYYLSDSCFSFRGKNPFELIKKIGESNIQILLHPVHFSDDGGEYDQILPKLFASQVENFHNSCIVVNKKYHENIGDSHTNFIKLMLKI